MPHQCLKCGAIYDNASDAILKGCKDCGAKFFLYIKKEPDTPQEIELSSEQKDLLLKEVEQLIEDPEPEKPIILKLENIRVLAPGKYEIDINQLLQKDKPVVYKVQEGTYVIDLQFLKEKNE